MMNITVLATNGVQHDYPASNPPQPTEEGCMAIGNEEHGALWAPGSWQAIEWTAQSE